MDPSSSMLRLGPEAPRMTRFGDQPQI
jgi:hypothetical protein